MEVINASRIDRTQPLFNPSSGVTLEDSEIVQKACSGSGSGGGKDCGVDITFGSDSDRTLTEMRYTFYSTDGQGSSPTQSHPKMELVDQDGNIIQTFQLRGDFQPVSVDVPNSDDPDDDLGEMRVRFKKGGSGAEVGPGDYFVISAIIDGKERETYFAAPMSGKSGG